MNEDNYFFYSFQPYTTIPEPVISVLEKRFGDWLLKKYGSLDVAAKAWGPPEQNKPIRGDSFAEGRVGLLSAGSLRGEGRFPQRQQDTAQFLTEDFRSVLASFQEYLKKDLGFKGLVNGSNWLSADRQRLEPLDKYANSVCDVMDIHGVGWYSPSALARSWAFAAGDKYLDASPLLDPDACSIKDFQYTGKVHIISEPKAAMPNRFRSDWFPLMAAYSSLQGTDAVMHFAGAPTWANTLSRWSIDSPAQMGQCPATALMFRNRYIKEAPPVIEEYLQLSDLYQLKGSGLKLSNMLDENTNQMIRQDSSDAPVGAMDNLAFFAGRVQRTVAEPPGKSKAADLSPYIERGARIVRSITGELTWDYGKGLLTINAPCARGAVGFVGKAGLQTLGNVTITSPMEYGSILIVSMDGLPITSSSKILLQVMSEDRNYGWRSKPVRHSFGKGAPVTEAQEIVSTGDAPILVRNLAGTITLSRPDAGELAVVALDFNGYKVADLPKGRGPQVQIELRKDSVYYVISK